MTEWLRDKPSCRDANAQHDNFSAFLWRSSFRYQQLLKHDFLFLQLLPYQVNFCILKAILWVSLSYTEMLILTYRIVLSDTNDILNLLKKTMLEQKKGRRADHKSTNAHLEPFGTLYVLWDHLVPYCTIWDPSRSFRFIWNHLEPYQTIQAGVSRLLKCWSDKGGHFTN